MNFEPLDGRNLASFRICLAESMERNMNDADFEARKKALDQEIDALDPTSPVGIKLGWDLYTEFRGRGLLKPKRVDMVLWDWMQPGYRDRFIADGTDIPDDEYRVGKADAPPNQPPEHTSEDDQQVDHDEEDDDPYVGGNNADKDDD